VSASLRLLFDEALDLFLPRRCVVCGEAGGWLCSACGPGLVSLEGPLCDHCGGPTHPAAASPQGPGCHECGPRTLGFISARAAYRYEGAARKLVTACKFRALRSLVREMAGLAAPAFIAGLPVTSGDEAPLVVTSVPAHRDHRLERGFDQAELLAREFAAAADLTYAPLLVRTRHGRRQSELSGRERTLNVRGAFVVAPSASKIVEQAKRVVIVDDVYTTGATLSECAMALRAVECGSHAFTFARTVRVVHS